MTWLAIFLSGTSFGVLIGAASIAFALRRRLSDVEGRELAAELRGLRTSVITASPEQFFRQSEGSL